MSEEKTQVFRGDEAPEMAIAETSEPVRAKSADAPADARSLQDQKDGPSHARAIGDATDGATDQRRIADADGLAELRQLHDAEGRSELRQMQDADGISEQRQIEDAEGPSEQRQIREGFQSFREPALDDAGEADAVAGAANDTTAQAASATVDTGAPAQKAPSDPDLTFSVEEDATPWALSIHLEERIALLGATNAKVNEQLNGLEDSIRRLAKRIGR